MTVPEFWESGTPYFEKIFEKIFQQRKSHPEDRRHKKWYTKQEARDYLSVSMVTLDKIIKSGKLPIYNPSPDRILLLDEDMDRYLLSTQKAA